jgi:hypothetical protein
MLVGCVIQGKQVPNIVIHDCSLNAAFQDFRNTTSESDKMEAADVISSRLMYFIRVKKVDIPVSYVVSQLGDPDGQADDGCFIIYTINKEKPPITVLSLFALHPDRIHFACVSYAMR